MTPFTPQISLYQRWLEEQRGLSFDSYDKLWRWSTTDLDSFWQSIWDYFDLRSSTEYTAVCDRPASGRMVDVQWFTGARFNYAQQVFRHVDAAVAVGQAMGLPDGLPAIISHNEKTLGQEPAREMSWPELRQKVASLALHLQAQGVAPGDRVAAYLPNIPEAMVAFLATVSIGGVWSICAPDMGTNAVLDRFRQIEPKVLIACDGVTFGGRDHDRLAVVAELCAALPSVQHVVLHDNLGTLDGARHDPKNTMHSIANKAYFTPATAQNDHQTTAFEPLWLPFDHPLWIVYSSGTTGLPKPIVHGHGGTVIVALALKVLHNDVGCSYHPNSLGERYHWYSSTGWVMWNAQMSGLLNGTTCCLFDGNPGGSTVDAAGNKCAPDWTTLWRFGAELGVTFFGAGAAFFANCMKAGIDLTQCGDLSAVRALGTTGSPLSPEVQLWGTQQFRKIRAKSARTLRPVQDERMGELPQPVQAEPVEAFDIWWCNISGGTDFAGAFIGGNRELPLVAGEMQCRLLGCAVEAWNEQGEPVIGEVGELVCTQPIPSMPLFFWGDVDKKRYLSSYFDTYPNVWRHGDWLKINASGSCIIYGRSDATINRHGLRMGTSELYSAVEALPEVLDSMVVDLEYLGRESYMPLFVVLQSGLQLNDALRSKIVNAIKTALSPRFVPNDIFQVAEIPRTLSGKKQELPIKKLLLGQPIDKVVNKDAMANPGCLDWYVAFAEARQAGNAPT
ncbi:MAG: acetoacetate--CoA ligase [Burkholderiaceae bacterium]|nr:acetoacetate--CoA ligase [Burkholderiaceae bacterium]